MMTKKIAIEAAAQYNRIAGQEAKARKVRGQDAYYVLVCSYDQPGQTGTVTRYYYAQEYRAEVGGGWKLYNA